MCFIFNLKKELLSLKDKNDELSDKNELNSIKNIIQNKYINDDNNYIKSTSTLKEAEIESLKNELLLRIKQEKNILHLKYDNL